MQSHLTRVVFRRILDGRHITSRECLYQRHRTLRHAGNLAPRLGGQRFQQRTFWTTIFPRTPQKNKQLPGLKVMRDLVVAETRDSRRPEDNTIRGAFVDLFADLDRKQLAIYESTAAVVRRAVAQLIRNRLVEERSAELDATTASATSLRSIPISKEALLSAIRVLGRVEAVESTGHHQCLARELEPLVDKALTDVEGGFSAAEAPQVVMWTVKMLGKNDKASSAFAFLDRYFEKVGIDTPMIQKSFVWIFEGMQAHGASSAEVETILQCLSTRTIPFSHDMRLHLTRYYVATDQLQKALETLAVDVSTKGTPLQEPVTSKKELATILEGCIRLKDEKIGRKVLESFFEKHSDDRKLWVQVFKFAAATGRGVDEVERLVAVMERRSNLELDIEMVNELVLYASQVNDAYMAERFVSLATSRNIRPDATTHIYQIQARLSANDVDGAIAAYERSRGLPATAPDEERDRSIYRALNDLIEAMCKVERRYSYESIMTIVDDLNARSNPFFSPRTIACLTLLHLRREEYHDVVDLLQKYTETLASEERQVVSAVMVDYCFDTRNTVAKVWDCYRIMRSAFGINLDRNVLTRIMNEMYRRRRADIGFHVFADMRDNPNPEQRANHDTYVDALAGLAQCRDTEALEHVHNQLKLDPQLEPNTRVFNALMLAYIGVGNPGRAQDFWDDISASREGPSRNSILIMLRACEQEPYGIEQAKPIWQKVLDSDMEVTKDLFTAWAACQAGNHEVKDAAKTLRSAGEFGFELDDWILASVFNAARDRQTQLAVGNMMKEEYPVLYEQFRSTPRTVHRAGYVEHYRFDRKLSP